jgi:hypothetical protein
VSARRDQDNDGGPLIWLLIAVMALGLMMMV